MGINGINQSGQGTIMTQMTSTQKYSSISSGENIEAEINVSDKFNNLMSPRINMEDRDSLMKDGQNNGEQPSNKDIQKAMDKLNKFLEDENIMTEYSTHNKFNNTIMIRIVNKDTKEVILEVPPKKILDMVAKMCELVGVLVDERA